MNKVNREYNHRITIRISDAQRAYLQNLQNPSEYIRNLINKSGDGSSCKCEQKER